MVKALAISLWVFVMAHIFFNIQEWYWLYWWLDSVMHFLGGGLAAFLLLYVNLILPQQDRIKNTILLTIGIVGGVAFIGVLWEFHEFAADLFIKDSARVMQAGVGDTMSDLFFGILGGSMFLLCQPFYKRPLASTEAKN